MIPKDCKRLAEVDFPIADVGKYALAEKARRMGTPHQLHLWWAWRPLAACRAMLLGLLLPDPCDENCLEDFKKKARDLLPCLIGKVGPKDEDLRRALIRFIADFANWNVSSQPTYIEVGRGLVKAAHGEETPLVVDSFSGGGSIPIEALRVGCDAFASDLNPVACLILNSKLNNIPRQGIEVSEEFREVGLSVLKKSQEDLTEIFPKDKDNSTPIAYLWARVVLCESPNCGAEIPLIRSFWLSKKAKHEQAFRYRVDKLRHDTPHLEFEIFKPKLDKDVPGATVTRAKATCLCCNMVLPPERVRAQLAEQRGGADVVFDKRGNRVGGAQMLAVVTLQPGAQGRHYRLPSEHDYKAVWKAQKMLSQILDEWERDGRKGLCPVPNEPLPPVGTLGFRVQRYGMLQWGDLFTVRQKVALLSLTSHAQSVKQSAVKELLALSLSKLAERNNTICDWMVSVECPGHLYTQQDIPPAWDFAEAAPLGASSGSFELALEHTATNAAACYAGSKRTANVHQLDAANLSLPDESASIFFTDPPYYDAVPYSDLSDFFYVWLKRVLPQHSLLRDQFDPQNPLTPKALEAVQDEAKQYNGRPKDRQFFEERMAEAFAEGRRVLKEDGLGCVVFAHKTTEGWEALLTGLIRGGWTITASWPIATERSARMRARESAALSSSVHLVCRPRPEKAPVGDWGDVLRELPNRVGDWMERLQGEGIRGADLVFACIGPALEIYSRYSKVVDPQEREIPLGGNPEAVEPHTRGYLAYVWETVGRIALEQVLGTSEARARNGAAGALEEDARLTALFLWTLQSTNGQNGTAPDPGEDAEGDTGEEEDDAAPRGKAKGFSLVFDVVRRFAQPLGINLPLWENRIITTEKGVVRLLPVSERARQLFGDDGVGSAADWIEDDPVKQLQLALFPEMEQNQAPRIRGRGRRKVNIDPSAVNGESMRKATTLDRVHAAMLLQAGGQANALRALIGAEQDRGPDFLRLANALSALYPKESEEKRLLDAMLLAVPR